MGEVSPMPPAHHPVLRLRNGTKVVDLRVHEMTVDSHGVKVPEHVLHANKITSLDLQVGERISFLIYSNGDAINMVVTGQVADSENRSGRKPVLHAKDPLPEHAGDFVTTTVNDRQFCIPVSGIVEEIVPSHGIIIRITQNETRLNALRVTFRKK